MRQSLAPTGVRRLAPTRDGTLAPIQIRLVRMSSATDHLTRERLRETIELLESIAADRSVLAGVPEEERKRLLQAVANVYSPDRVERRRMAKIVDRQRKAARVKGDQ